MFMDPFGLHARHRANINNALALNNGSSRPNQNQLALRRDDPFQMMMSNPFSLMESMMGNMNRMFGNMVS